MTKIRVVNIKCRGCVASIVEALEKAGLKSINIDTSEQLVSFEGDSQQAKEILSKMGYPEAGTREASRLTKKAKSFVSCAIGRLRQ